MQFRNSMRVDNLRLGVPYQMLDWVVLGGECYRQLTDSDF